MWTYVSDALALLDSERRALFTQPGVPSVTVLVAVTGLATLIAGALALWATVGVSAVGNERSLAQLGFSLYVAFGRVRNLLCSPCDRARKRYPGE
jgi:hypothetical protein